MELAATQLLLLLIGSAVIGGISLEHGRKLHHPLVKNKQRQHLFVAAMQTTSETPDVPSLENVLSEPLQPNKTTEQTPTVQLSSRLYANGLVRNYIFTYLLDNGLHEVVILLRILTLKKSSQIFQQIQFCKYHLNIIRNWSMFS